MKKIRFKPPIALLTKIPLYITHIEYDDIKQTLLLSFPLLKLSEGLSNTQKEASEIQKVTNELSTKTTGRPENGIFYCKVPETTLATFEKWLCKHSAPAYHAYISQVLGESQLPSHADMPTKGKYSTELLISAFYKSDSAHDIAIAIKLNNKNEYIFKEELLAILEAFHGEVSRLLFSPTFSPKVRSVHEFPSGKALGVLSKKVSQFISIYDLFEKYKKVLTVKELVQIGMARLLMFGFATADSDLHSKNYGIDRPLNENNEIAKGTCLIRLDPFFACYPMINYACKIFGIKNFYGTRTSNAFARAVAPENSFPIHQEDIASLPRLVYATPYNWPYYAKRPLLSSLSTIEEKEKAATANIDHLEKDEAFKRDSYQHALKLFLIEAAMIENIGKAFISDSAILNTLYGNDFSKTFQPSFIDTKQFELDAQQYGEEYRKAILKILYVKYCNERFSKMCQEMLQMPEFREHLLKYDDQYFHSILREFQEYNNQFLATKKTNEEDILLIEKTEGVHLKIPYKRKYLNRLINLDDAKQKLIGIRDQALILQTKYHQEFIVSLKKYLQSHDWTVGFQITKKLIPDLNGMDKAVPTCVFNQFEEIKKYERREQTLEVTINKIMDLGEETYKHHNSSSNSSTDSLNYYSLFKEKHVYKVFQTLKSREAEKLENFVFL